MKKKEPERCCFCGKELIGTEWNNPAPVVNDENAVCCDECNRKIVLPARMATESAV